MLLTEVLPKLKIEPLSFDNVSIDKHTGDQQKQNHALPKSAILLVFLMIALTAATADQSIVVDKQEAQKAFLLLQDIRSSPNNYSRELHFNSNLKTSSIKLQWNDTLAKVAEVKAYDMANRNYFGHVDPDGVGINYFIDKAGYKLEAGWLTKKSDNFFESLSANLETGEAAIKYLVEDEITPSLGHRKHLLGLDKWNSNLTDIGIGFVRRNTGSTYQTYICVIIAKHGWE